jgi:hypothetical protein
VTSAPLSVRTKITRLSKFFARSTAPLKPAHSKRFATKIPSANIAANITAFFQTPSARTNHCARRT